jgi:hypothetical protein
MCIEHLRNKKFHVKNVFRKNELEQLANSEPGAKFSVFQKKKKTVSLSLGSAVTIGELSSQSYMRQKLLRHQVTNAYHILRFPRKKGMGNY